MRPVSDALLRSLRGSHGIQTRARVVSTWQTGTNPDGVEIPILAGNVIMDQNAKVRSTLEMTTNPALWPVRVDDLLAPFGAEIFVERGVRLSNAVTEWVSLGYYRIDTVEQADAPTGLLRISASDRMAGIVEGDLVVPRQWPATATYGQVLTDLVTDIYPSVAIEWDDSTSTQPVGRQIICERGRFDFADDLVKSVGKVWHWDHRGIPIIRDLPDPADPVWEVVCGEGGVLVSLSQTLTRASVHNGVVASGDAADTQAPPRAVAVDANPNSPTRWGGPFGKAPTFFSSPLLTTHDRCAKAAATLLMKELGLPHNVDFTAVPNPALEPLDPVRVRPPRASARVHTLERVTMPLIAEQPMVCATREQTAVLIGQEV